MNAELTVRKTIEEHALIPKGSTVILGLSGGPDSLCLLYILHGLQRTFDFKLKALHLNHLMRGEAAQADVEFLERTCGELDVPLTVVSCDVYKKAADEGISVEEAGRAARHEALKAAASSGGEGVYSPGDPAGANVTLTALAHNKNDQAETVLMNLARGTGLKGAGGVCAVRELAPGIRLVHPLLGILREDMRSWLYARGYAWREDETNEENIFLRNRIRNEVLPLLTGCVNEKTAEHIAAAAEDFAEADAFFCAEASDIADRWTRESGGSALIPCRKLLSLKNPLPAYVLKEAAGRLDPSLPGQLGRRHIEALLALAGGSGSRESVLPGGVKARAVYDSMWFEHEKDVSTETKVTDLSKRENQLVWSVFPAKTRKKMPQGSCANWFDYDKINGRLEYRTRRNGDRICVYPDGRTKSLGDVLTDSKVPFSERGNISVLAVESRLLWVPGLRMAQDLKVNEDTQLILEVKRGETSNEG